MSFFLASAAAAASAVSGATTRRRPDPGAWAQRDTAVRRALGAMCQPGFSMELQKPITPAFTAQHSVVMGAQVPKELDQYMYSYGVTLMGMDYMATSQVTKDGRVNGQYIKMLGPGTKFTGIWQVSSAAHASALVGELEQHGSDYTATARLQSGPRVTLTYFQSLTPELAVGGEFMYSEAELASMSQIGFRYRGNKWQFLGTYDPQGLVQAAYIRSVSSRVRLGTELQYIVPRRDYELRAGAEFSLKQGKLAFSISSSGVVTSMLEEKVNPNFTLGISAELDHKRESSRFGVSVNIANQ